MKYFYTEARPTIMERRVLSLLPFVILVSAYTIFSYTHDITPAKLVPTPVQIFEGFLWSLQENAQGVIPLLKDTLASGSLFLVSLVIILFAIPAGAMMGVFPYFEANFRLFTLVIDKVPAVAILPILFITMGTGHLGKVAFIVFAIFSIISLDTYHRAKDVPVQQKWKAKALGATDWEVAFRVVLPQILPQAMNTVRLNIKPMLLLLLAAEGFSAEFGIGKRVFLHQRWNDMDVILAYVIWGTVLLMLVNWLFELFIKWRYKWSQIKEGE